MTDADNLALLGNTQVESLLHSQKKIAESIGHYVNANKTELMDFKQKRDISMMSGES